MHGTGDSGSTTPAFLTKLWTLVDDESTNELICWDVSGKSFHVFDQGTFAKEILPLYFKHNNIASFIRQLNMYGFRKVVNVENGGLKVEKDDLEFAHPYFLQGHMYLLENIKRKVSNVKGEEVRVKHDGYNKVLNDVHSLRGKQDSMNTKLDTLKLENEALWREVANLRQKHMKQQQIVNKLIQFIVTLVGSNRGIQTGLKRHMPLMINDASQLASPPKMAKLSQSLSDPTSGVLIHDVTEQMQGSPGGLAKGVSESPIIDFMEEASPKSREQLEPLALLTEATPASLEELTEIIDPSVAVASSVELLIMPEEETATTTSPTPSTSNPTAKTASQPTVSTALAITENKSVNEGRRSPSECDFRGDMNDHLDNMQADLDSLKDLLSTGSYSLDNSTILGLFNPEGPIPPTPENMFVDFMDAPLGDALSNSLAGTELMAYQPADATDLGQLFDLRDIADSDPLELATANFSTELETPIVSPVSSKQITTEEVD